MVTLSSPLGALSGTANPDDAHIAGYRNAMDHTAVRSPARLHHAGLLRRIEYFSVAADLRAARQGRRLRRGGADNVQHLMSAGEQIIADNPAMTAPPHRFGAHH